MTVQAQPPAASDVVDEVLALVRQHGGRVTAARRLLLRALFDSQGHRSADELAAAVHVLAPEVNQTTIYRNLDELERLQVVDKTHLGPGPATYHVTATAHGHLLCRQCGTLTEVPGDLFDALGQAARDRYGFTIQPRRFAAIGLCTNCQTVPSQDRRAVGADHQA